MGGVARIYRELLAVLFCTLPLASCPFVACRILSPLRFAIEANLHPKRLGNFESSSVNDKANSNFQSMGEERRFLHQR